MSGPGLHINYSYENVPTIKRFAQSDAFVRGLMGPVGGGKSAGSIVEFVRRSQAMPRSHDGIRHSRWGVVRNTFSELRDTTLKSIFQWMPPQYFGHYAESRHSYSIKAFPGVDMELLFIAMDRPDDVKKLLSLELTGGFVNEAREVPWAAIDLMQSRLGRYPPKRDISEPYWYGMWMDTNPPDSDSKFYRFYEEEKHPPGFAELFKQPGGRTPMAENLTNLPEGYYQKLAIGKAPEWIKIYIDGQYGFLVEGKLVYPEYNDAVHCKDVHPIEGVTIIRSWDFGLTPCCVFSQMLPDGRWLVFDEMTSDNMSIDQFSDDVLNHCQRAFRGAKPRFEDWGDPAGEQRVQTDSRTCFQIMLAKEIQIEGSIQDPTLRQEAVRKVLRTPGQDWEPMFIINPRCKVLRKGFMGGYHRRRMQTAGPERYSSDPQKNEYSHPHDALQYALVQYFGTGLTEKPSDDNNWDFGQDVDYAADATRNEVTGY